MKQKHSLKFSMLDKWTIKDVTAGRKVGCTSSGLELTSTEETITCNKESYTKFNVQRIEPTTYGCEPYIITDVNTVYY